MYRGIFEGHGVAIKMIKHQANEASELFKREVEMLKTVRGPNVITFYGASVEQSNEMFHVTELMDLGTLSDVLKKNTLSPQIKLKIMKDVAVGMATVHSFNVIHRDLKPDNVLCKSPFDLSNAEMCKMTDFGTSRVAENVFAMTMTKGQGTPLYMAPEMLAGQKRYNKSVDVYSYGILCAVVWNDGALPYTEYNYSNHLEMQNAIIQGLRPKLMTDCPLEPLITRCWSGNAKERPPFDWICEQSVRRLGSIVVIAPV